MTTAKRNEHACSVIDKFGGTHAAARALKTYPSTVQHWKKAGIPVWRWPQIVAAAAVMKINLPREAA